MSRIYLDACIAIYFIERHPDFATKVETIIESLNSEDTLCHSPLVRMECLVMPLRKTDTDLLALYESFFNEQQMLAMSPERFDEAAQLRASFPSLKTPDALHLATAIHHGCDEFWTNDNRLNSVAPNIVKNVLSN